MKNFLRLLKTLKYLKYQQIIYRIFYTLRSKLRKLFKFSYNTSLQSNPSLLSLEPSIPPYNLFRNGTFNFLNQEHYFKYTIDWNHPSYGKLWTYNINYFEYILQEDIKNDLSLKLIYNFIDSISTVKDGLEPFPISLRCINWIKYISLNQIEDKKISNSLYVQYKILMDNIEYHLLGNHLLENGFSLLFGAYYFQDQLFYQKAKEILTEELEEQVLKDGAHFELSPMYHQIMLFRVLDCINLVQNNSWKEKELLPLLKEKAEVMLAWLENMTFTNGEIPLLNDSANGIAPTTLTLLEYGNRLGIESKHQKLGDSGYRKFSNDKYECIIDVGNIGPDYIPGHAHADTFNFILYVDEKPFIVDTGLSTYETNERRTLERSTCSHNTVEIASMNQSNVWGGFRVAERAYVISLEENDTQIKAIHDGYKKSLNSLHERTFIFEDDSIKITDTILSDITHIAVSRIHFHPSVDEKMIYECVDLSNLNYNIKKYLYAPEFNKHLEAKMIEITFDKISEMKINL